MLTRKQQQAYQFIREYIEANHISPTDAEIAEGLGIKSRGVAHRYVSALADAGLIHIESGRRRNITLAQSANELCIIGRIAAGSPIEALEEPRTLDFSDSLLGENRFILEVKGDSMIGDSICDGDFIICEKAHTASKNDIVVALVDNNEATLKRLHNNHDGTVTLIPSNPSLSPMVYSSEQVKIQGIYLGLLRINK